MLDGGNIIFGGRSYQVGFFPGGCNAEIDLFRYDTNGVADSTFGSNGTVEYDLYDVNNCAQGIDAPSFALQPDDKIVTAGGSNDGNGNEGLTLTIR